MEIEIWKQVAGFEGLYEISNLGRVKSLFRVIRNKVYPTKIISQCTTRKGYKLAGLFKPGVRNKKIAVHRLVAQMFIPNPNNLPQVNHKDGVKDNNCVSNLEWCTNQENVLHAFRVLKRKVVISGMGKVKSKVQPVIQFDVNGNEVSRFKSIVGAARLLGISECSLRCCLSGRRKLAAGYKWKYESKELGIVQTKFNQTV